MSDEGLTLGTSTVGRELSSRQGSFERAHSQQGGAVRGFTRAFFSGVTTHALAALIAALVRSDTRLMSTWHVAGPVISKYDLLRRLNDAASLDMEIVPDAALQIDRSLNGTAFVRATGLVSPSWDEMFEQYTADLSLYG